MFTFVFFGIDAFEPGGVVLFVSAEFFDGTGAFGMGAAPDDVAVLKEDIIASVFFCEVVLVVAVIEGLFAGCLAEKDNAFFAAHFSGVEFGEWGFEAA